MKTYKRNHTIDVLKGLLIIFVVFTHYDWTNQQRHTLIFSYIINMAIPCFMIISGWNYSLSFEKREIDNFEKAYSLMTITTKLIRYSFPFLFMVLWIAVDRNVGGAPSKGVEILRWVLQGTNGKGSYYYPVMIQLIFIFPIIYFSVSAKERLGLWIWFIASMVYELLIWAYEISTVSYRLLVFRYMFMIAVGVYAYKRYGFNRIQGILVSSIGAIWIFLVAYTRNIPIFINKDWASTNAIASMFIAPIMVWLLQNAHLSCLPLEMIGKASYHIFLVQLVYYLGYSKKIALLFDGTFYKIVLSIFICITIGICFYYIESFLTKTLICSAKYTLSKLDVIMKSIKTKEDHDHL